eukprot:g2644.t1
MTGPYAFQCNVLYPFWAGASCVVEEDCDRRSSEACRFLELAREHRPTVVSLTPKMIRSLLRSTAVGEETAARSSLSSLRYMITAGDVLPSALHAEWLDRFGIELLDGLGNSEAFSFYVSNRLGSCTPGSVGTRVGGFGVKRVDASGCDIKSPDEPGEIWVRGNSVSDTYWDRPRESADVFVNGGWFRTGDIATEDVDGRFYLLGRKTDLRSLHDGEWRNLRFSFLEIENRLLSERGVEDCAVCEGAAFLVVSPCDDEEDTRKRVRAILDDIYPHEAFDVHLLGGIPRNARDKIDRSALRELAADAARK